MTVTVIGTRRRISTSRRLIFSLGIYMLTACAALLLIIFGGITDRLIPLFAIGAFLAFTLSQAGMVARRQRKQVRHADEDVEVGDQQEERSDVPVTEQPACLARETDDRRRIFDASRLPAGGLREDAAEGRRLEEMPDRFEAAQHRCADVVPRSGDGR